MADEVVAIFVGVFVAILVVGELVKVGDSVPLDAIEISAQFQNSSGYPYPALHWEFSLGRHPTTPPSPMQLE